MIRQHLGDFLGNLSQNTITKYEFCPIPKVSYQCLGKELFCHHYYLRNLCDPRFEKWPITEPAEVFHSCLQKWNDLISRDSLHDHDAQDHAREVLGLEKGYDEEALRRAYVSLSKTCYLHKV
jgi:DnaJ family protein C protein 13